MSKYKVIALQCGYVANDRPVAPSEEPALRSGHMDDYEGVRFVTLQARDPVNLDNSQIIKPRPHWQGERWRKKHRNRGFLITTAMGK